ncbi:MAG: class I SAM-dependent methyltransferase [Candidatus Latescibacterota bacterium]
MKGRESGMPEENYWDTFFNAECIVQRLVCPYAGDDDIVEFGSGYGTFTIPASQCNSGMVYTFDIEPELVDIVKHKALSLGLKNVKVVVRDFIEQGTGLPPGSAGHVMIYNLLHIESPTTLLREAYRVLKPGGVASIIHWRCDRSTPRGPSLDIRPTPEQCQAWAETVGFRSLGPIDLSHCCEYHYGIVIVRPE